MNSLITLAYFVMSKSFSLIVHINYQMTVILSREISSGLSPMSCVQTLQTCLAATCLLVWSHESGQDLTSRVRELVALLYFFSDIFTQKIIIEKKNTLEVTKTKD